MKRPTILIVDDVDINRDVLSAQLSGSYNILEAQDGVEALEILNLQPDGISLLLLDIIMPKLDGFEVLQIVKSNKNLSDIPVILITASGEDEIEQLGFKKGAVDFITKPFNPHLVRARIDAHVELKMHRDQLKREVEMGVQKLDQLWITILHTLASVIEYRSLESGQHIKRTQLLTEILLTEMIYKHSYSISEVEKDAIIQSSALHDIGKIGIPDNILLKPGKLTPEEFDEIKKHTIIGEEISKKFFMEGQEQIYVTYFRQVCRSHHEMWSGQGYPDGIKGEDIPICARVVSLVDVYDALVSDRVYKKAYTKEEALAIIKRDSGRHFEPKLVEIFLSIQDQIDKVYNSYAG